MDGKWFRIRCRWLVLHAFAFGLGAAGCGDDAPDTCEYAGKTHEVGDLFPSSDGCNMCGCESGGSVVCTEKACSRGEGCDDDGVRRDQGERWTAEGGCSSCVCNANGTITCSVTTGCEAGCTYGRQRFAPGSSFPSTDGCNTCTCGASGEVACTQRACGGSCQYANQIFPVGASFKATDGCNECTCAAPSMVRCTTNSCSLCTYNGRSYAEGDEFVIADGCTHCVCGPNGGSTCNSDDCPDDACNFGSRWFDVGDEVICPDGCSTCTCGDSQDWQAGSPSQMCRQRFAELCAAGPGQNQVDASLLYLSVDSLAVETTTESCEASYLLCFNPREASGELLPVDVWVVQVEASCEPDQLKTQFVFDVASIRDHVWTHLPMRTQVVTLQMGDEQFDYPL